MQVLNSTEIQAVSGGYNYVTSSFIIDIQNAPISQLPALIAISNLCIENSWNGEQLVAAFAEAGIDSSAYTVSGYFAFQFYN